MHLVIKDVATYMTDTLWPSIETKKNKQKRALMTMTCNTNYKQLSPNPPPYCFALFDSLHPHEWQFMACADIERIQNPVKQTIYILVSHWSSRLRWVSISLWLFLATGGLSFGHCNKVKLMTLFRWKIIIWNVGLPALSSTSACVCKYTLTGTDQ